MDIPAQHRMLPSGKVVGMGSRAKVSPPSASAGYPDWKCRRCGKQYPENSPKGTRCSDTSRGYVCNGELTRYLKAETL